MKLGMNHPMGPLALADFTGWTPAWLSCASSRRDRGSRKYRPALGWSAWWTRAGSAKKTGKGFSDYAGRKP